MPVTDPVRCHELHSCPRQSALHLVEDAERVLALAREVRDLTTSGPATPAMIERIGVLSEALKPATAQHSPADQAARIFSLLQSEIDHERRRADWHKYNGDAPFPG